MIVRQQVCNTDKELFLSEPDKLNDLNPIVTALKKNRDSYLVLSRFNDDIWYFPDSWFPSNTQQSSRKLVFSKIDSCWHGPLKTIMSRIIYDDTNDRKFSGSTYVGTFKLLRSITTWLESVNITDMRKINSIVGHQFLTYLKKSDLSQNYQQRLARVLDKSWGLLNGTKYQFSHPWGGENYQSIIQHEKSLSPKTEIIPDSVLTVLFNSAENDLERVEWVLECRDIANAIAKEYSHMCYEAIAARRKKALSDLGWEDKYYSIAATIFRIRTSCIVIILLTTGMRVHEVINIKNNGFRSEVKDGDRFHYILSSSDKTYEGDTEWLAPEIAVTAVKIAQRLASPAQQQAIIEYKSAIKNNDDKEAERLFNIRDNVFLGKCGNSLGDDRKPVSTLSGHAVRGIIRNYCKSLKVEPISPHRFRRTFANYVVHSNLGDLRYLRDHFKHWSIDMTTLYGANEKLDMELFDLLYSEFDIEKKEIVSHWLDPDTPLSGGLAFKLSNLRSKSEDVHHHTSQEDMVNEIAKHVNIRATGIAWCTNERNGCGGGRCEECEHGIVDDSQRFHWEAMLEQQLELIPLVEDCGEAGIASIQNGVDRCKKVLNDLGVDTSEMEERVLNYESTS